MSFLTLLELEKDHLHPLAKLYEFLQESLVVTELPLSACLQRSNHVFLDWFVLFAFKHFSHGLRHFLLFIEHQCLLEDTCRWLAARQAELVLVLATVEGCRDRLDVDVDWLRYT
jgi:hypothetical protein